MGPQTIAAFRRARLLMLAGLLGLVPSAVPGCHSRGAANGPFAVVTPAASQQRGREAIDSVIERALLAQRMARQGRATRSPLALMAAAEILLDNPPRALDERTPMVAPDDSAAARAAGAGPALDPRSLLAEARAMAADNDPLLGVVAQLERRAEAQAAGHVRGSTAGPRQRFGRIAPGGQHVYEILFSGRLTAVVYVSGDGDIPLELTVYDPRNRRGAPIAFDRGTTDKSVVQWRPAQTSRYAVHVRNGGTRSTWYLLLTN